MSWLDAKVCATQTNQRLHTTSQTYGNHHHHRHHREHARRSPVYFRRDAILEIERSAAKHICPPTSHPTQRIRKEARASVCAIFGLSCAGKSAKANDADIEAEGAVVDIEADPDVCEEFVEYQQQSTPPKDVCGMYDQINRHDRDRFNFDAKAMREGGGGLLCN